MTENEMLERDKREMLIEIDRLLATKGHIELNEIVTMIRKSNSDRAVVRLRIIHKGKHYIPTINDGDKPITLVVDERTCPICDKKWFSCWVDDIIIFGGISITMADGISQEHCGCFF